MLQLLKRSAFARRLGGEVAVGVTLLAGCGQPATSAKSFTQTLTPTPRSAPSSAGPSLPSRSGRAGPADAAKGPSGSARNHLAPGLESRLPSALDGTKLTRVSTTGSAIFQQFGGAAWSQRMSAFLDRVGKTPADLQFAQLFDPSKKTALDAGAFRLPGVPATDLATAIIDSAKPDSPGLISSSTSIDGKKVTVQTDPASGAVLYLFPRDDTVFYVGGDDPPLAKQFLNAVR